MCIRDSRARPALLVITGAFLASLAVVAKLADSVTERGQVVRVDQVVVDFALHHRVGWISQTARVVTLMGSVWLTTAIVLVAAMALVLSGRRLDALFVVLSSGGTALLVFVTKAMIGRQRPAAPHRLVAAAGAAFPSGHAAQSVACYGALAIIAVAGSRSTGRRVVVASAAAVIAIAVGASRVYLGVHWPSDVLSGWLLAVGWLLALVGARTLAKASVRPNPGTPDRGPAPRHPGRRA